MIKSYDLFFIKICKNINYYFQISIYIIFCYIFLVGLFVCCIIQ